MRSWDEKSVREEALKYKRKGDFQKGSNLAYQYAWRHNLLMGLVLHLYFLSPTMG